MGAQYTHRTVRTKDIPSPCIFLFSYQFSLKGVVYENKQKKGACL
ncbi:hypothetical protein HMPREF0860_2397 [Treponema socranskii subsp. socranskii VPI DR56BR1116 = ATCC 35536]|uniref:Uncharacterized protein n=1 Tax=Treponema socranskii subsp. socranskii VPI DR56BR1116 = ATCC 35536 TaxID=1125725 RepID=U1GV80_TRESO|nr:hypothetical protein HMPREF1325_0222 [Treponema socranskii subsp. socranskii VPI DR56BR1116 = ATCC 35536]ERK03292.1 hypothetical protein HMPREF0860_2397 [Treponema socranskii subsp. socranskii VPI DR56BR1116 = ATCC 35536]